jgi:hypothetical protein
MHKKTVSAVAAIMLFMAALSAQVIASAESDNSNVIELPIISVESSSENYSDSSSQTEDSSDSSLSDETEADVPVHTHSYVVKSYQPADCIHSGEKVYLCSCGESYSEKLPATGVHTYGAWVTTKAATCSADGSQYRDCNVCKKRETRAISYLGHSYTSKTVAPTYSEKGYTEHTCTRCKYTYRDCYTDKKVIGVPEFTSYVSSTSAIKLSWKKVSNAQGYRIYRYDDSSKKWVKVKTVSANVLSYKITGLKKGGSYKFRVRAYVKESGNTVWSNYSAAYNAVTKPSATVIEEAVAKSKSITVQWKTRQCSGYEVYILKNGKWKRAKTVTSSETDSYKITGLAKNMAYKVKVRAYMLDSQGKKVYGGFSKAVAVKTKA